MGSALAAIKSALGERWVDASASARYDRARKVFNGDIDRHPYAIAYCASVREIRFALEVASECSKQITVRSTGHNVAGRGVADDAVVIDLSAMNGVTVDPVARTAAVGPGTTWGVYDRAAQQHGLATPGGTVSTTGVTGLTLGGGIGWLLPSLGLSCDSLRGIRVLGTDGRICTLSDTNNPELMQAFRGGGVGLGIVTELYFDLHPVGQLIGGAIYYRIEDATEVLARLSHALPGVNDQLMVSPAFLRRGGRPVLELDLADTGPGNATDDLLTALRRIPEVRVDLAPRTYVDMQRYLDNPKREGLPAYWKTSFLSRLADDDIRILVEAIKDSPSPDCMIILEHYHGKYLVPGHRAGVFPHRSYAYNVIAIGAWERAEFGAQTFARRTDCVRWARQVVASLSSAVGHRQYVNYSSDEISDVEEPMRESMRELTEARQALDPAGLLVF